MALVSKRHRITFSAIIAVTLTLSIVAFRWVDIRGYAVRLSCAATQLQVSPSIVHHKPRVNKTTRSSALIIYWSTVFRKVPRLSVREKEWPYLYVDNRCPVDCTISTNKSRVHDAAALVVHARDSQQMPPDGYAHLPWILHTHENPMYAPSLRDSDYMAKFNYLLSYRLDSDFPCPLFMKPALDLPQEFATKRPVMAAYSNCEEARTNYTRELMKYIEIDSYGRCLHNKDGLSKRYSPGNARAVREMQRKYKFSLVFPNADCDYYVTEKMYNALSAGSVPVWLGTDKVDDFLKWGNLNHSIIKVKDFSSPKKLAEYLLYLSRNEKEYNRYLKWKYDGFNFPREYYSSAIGQWWDGLPLYCRVCMKVISDPKGHNGLPVDRCDGEQKRTLKKWWPMR